MKRILFAAIALAAVWGVFANEFVPVSAPTISGEAAELETVSSTGTRRLTPAEKAHLSALSVVAGVTKNAAATGEDAQAEDTQVTAAVTIPSAGELREVSALYQAPSEIVAAPGMLPMPAKPIIAPERTTPHGTDSDALLSATHTDALDTEPPTAVDAKPLIPQFLQALKEIPSSVVSAMSSEPEPEMPAILTAPATVEPQPAADAIADSNPTPSRSAISMFVSAVYEAPSAVIQKLGLFEKPAPPLAPEVQTKAGETISERPYSFYDIDGRMAAKAAPVMPTYVAAMSETPTAIFSPYALLALPTAPVVEAPARHFAFSREVPVEREAISQTAAKAQEAAPIRTEVSTGLADLQTAFVAAKPLTAIPAFTLPVAVRAPATVASVPVVSARTEIASDFIRPMVRASEPAPLLSEDSAALNDARTASGASEEFSRALAPVSEPARAAAPAPVLISGSTLFSADLLKPMSSTTTTARPFFNYNTAESVVAAFRQDGDYCDPNFVGDPIRFSQTVELKLEDLIRQLHQRFGVNFIIGKGVGELPMNIKAGSIPWNILLRSQLFVSGVRARCIDRNTIELVENKELPSLQDSADVTTRFIKLRFLQPTVGGNVNISGQSSGRGANSQNNQCSGQGGGGGFGGGGGGGGIGGGGNQACGNFEKLIIEIEKILGIRSRTQSSIGGGGGGQGTQQQQTEEIRRNRSVSIIPGRNMLVIQASDEEMKLIQQIIDRADRPPFQVIIKGLIYTANETKLKDIGAEPSIFASTADGRTQGSLLGDSLGAAGTLFDFSTIIGTNEFGLQVTALQENGVISIKSRPFATVLDGETADLTVGRQVPVLIQAQNNLGGAPGTLQILQAANLLSVTPQVIDDDQGVPIAVNLTLQLESNEVDTSVTSQGVPAVSVRSIQSRLILNQQQTAILGGFTVDSDSRTVRKTPLLGDIPIIGELFKRRLKSGQLNRLYFALAVEVVPFPGLPEPVRVPGATTDPPSITPEMKTRGDKAEPKQVTAPKTTGP